jgi:hypothetical protein
MKRLSRRRMFESNDKLRPSIIGERTFCRRVFIPAEIPLVELELELGLEPSIS